MERNPNILRRLGVIAKRPDARNGTPTEALEADALLLREENARLRVKLEAPPNMGQVIERLRALPTPAMDAEQGEDAWQMVTEVLVMRNSLIELCREIGHVMAGLETSLESLSPPDGFAVDGHRENGSLRNGLRRNGHLKEAQQS